MSFVATQQIMRHQSQLDREAKKFTRLIKAITRKSTDVNWQKRGELNMQLSEITTGLSILIRSIDQALKGGVRSVTSGSKPSSYDHGRWGQLQGRYRSVRSSLLAAQEAANRLKRSINNPNAIMMEGMSELLSSVQVDTDHDGYKDSLHGNPADLVIFIPMFLALIVRLSHKNSI